MGKKYIYLKDIHKIEEIETKIMYEVGQIQIIDGKSYYFRVNINKTGDYHVTRYNYEKYKYLDKTVCNKSSLINRIRKCDFQKVKKIFEFFIIISSNMIITSFININPKII